MAEMKSLLESASVSSVIGVGVVVRVRLGLSRSLDLRISKFICQILVVQ